MRNHRDHQDWKRCADRIAGDIAEAVAGRFTTVTGRIGNANEFVGAGATIGSAGLVKVRIDDAEGLANRGLMMALPEKIVSAEAVVGSVVLTLPVTFEALVPQTRGHCAGN